MFFLFKVLTKTLDSATPSSDKMEFSVFQLRLVFVYDLVSDFSYITFKERGQKI